MRPYLACLVFVLMLPAMSAHAIAFTPSAHSCREDEARDKRGVCRWIPDTRKR